MNGLADMLTEGDNQTVCVLRVGLLGLLIAFIVFTGWAVWKSGAFDPLGYGTAGGGLLAAGGAAIRLKAPGDAPK